jgi:hypothetical protein
MKYGKKFKSAIAQKLNDCSSASAYSARCVALFIQQRRLRWHDRLSHGSAVHIDLREKKFSAMVSDRPEVIERPSSPNPSIVPRSL